MLGRWAAGRIAPAGQRLLPLCRLQPLCSPLCFCKFVCAWNSVEFCLKCLLMVAMFPASRPIFFCSSAAVSDCRVCSQLRWGVEFIVHCLFCACRAPLHLNLARRCAPRCPHPSSGLITVQIGRHLLSIIAWRCHTVAGPQSHAHFTVAVSFRFPFCN